MAEKRTASPKQKASAKKPPKLTPGLSLKSRFELLEECGKGGLSRVFKAKDLVAEQAGLADPVVALKIISEAKDVDPDAIALMHREARRLRDLVHPNVIRVYDMDREGPLHFMVMEYLQGQTLAKALQAAPERKLEKPKVTRLIRDTATALAYVHSHSIVHADLKPGNVFIDRFGKITLIDFNIAFPVAKPIKTGEEDTQQILARFGAVTPAYASPQRLLGADPCEADDVFSLAVLSYLVMSGQRPFGKKTALEAQKEGLLPSPIEGASRNEWRALERALRLDDQGRTESVEEFATEFLQGTVMSTANRLLSRLSKS